MKTQKTFREVMAAYNKSAPLYDLMNQVYFLGSDKRFRAMIVERLKLKPNDAVLVLCCGTGLDFPFLFQKVKNQGILLGVDLSSGMLNQAKKRIASGVVDVIRSDVAHLPFCDKTFDAVLVSFCLKITPAYEQAIEESARVLKPAGRIGVLANSRPYGFLRLLGIVLTRILGAMAKINFEINIREQLSKRFAIIENRKIYAGLVRFLVGRKRVSSNTKECSHQ
ncbi:class I SAM-dependent methyltransferase [Candidatus Bathyarchaeota archaeon]|nr:class I SAM-dependent methyltransferase [Candidatus Bathyarchaeota archaeon]